MCRSRITGVRNKRSAQRKKIRGPVKIYAQNCLQAPAE